MGIKTCLAGLCLAVLAATVVDVPPVEAQTYTAQPDRPVNRPRARITVEPRSFLDAGTEVFDAFERGAKHGRACGLAPVAAAGAIRSSEPLQSVRLVTRPRLTAMAGAERFCSRWTLAEYAPAAAVRQMEKGSVRRLLAHPGEWK